jgi:hypothetical protein
MLNLRGWCCAVAAAVSGLACAQAGPAVAPPPGQRVLLTTVIEWPTLAEVSNRTARLAGVPVREVDEVGPRLYRLTLVCTSDAQCRDAVALVAADRRFVHSVEADARQRIPARPSGEATR